MEDFPARLADLLESTARKVRAMTVGRIAGAVNWTALGVIALFLATLAIIYLLVGTFRLLASVIGVKPAYAVITGLLVVGGAVLWRYRIAPEDRALARQIKKDTAAVDKAAAAEITAVEKAAEAQDAATEAEVAADWAKEALEPDRAAERDATPPPAQPEPQRPAPEGGSGGTVEGTAAGSPPSPAQEDEDGGGGPADEEKT